jgi:hypothetical protein
MNDEKRLEILKRNENNKIGRPFKENNNFENNMSISEYREKFDS